MFASRCLVASVTSALCFRRSYANNNTITSTYRERFEKLNEEDFSRVNKKHKADLINKFGYQDIIDKLDNEVIDDLHFISVMYTKPLSPERRIMLRKKILPYIEDTIDKQDNETQSFYEHILKYYEVL